MTIAQRIASRLNSIETAFWFYIHEQVENIFGNYRGFSTPARWLFSVLMAPLLVAWVLITGPIYALSCAQYRRQGRA